jgi:hypothetical protein
MADEAGLHGVAVSLEDGGNESECVRLEFAESPGRFLCLSPAQARALASELIQSVYKAEVKTSLRRNRRQGEPAAERVVQGTFSGPRAAGAQ